MWLTPTNGTSAVNACVLFAFCILALFVGNGEPAEISVTYERFEQVYGKVLINAENLRVKKFNRTVTVFDGTFDLYRDLDDHFSFHVQMSYSTLGNNQFIRSPYRIPQQKVCDIMNDVYPDYREFFRNMTNFPDVGVCPVPAQQYTIRNLVLDSTVINNYFQPGLWRYEFLVNEEGIEKPICLFELFFKVSRDDAIWA